MSINKSILRNSDNFELVSDLKDEYFYLFHRNIFSILNEEKVKKYNLMRSELIPFLINNIHHKKMQSFNPRNKCIPIHQNKDTMDKIMEERMVKQEKDNDFKVKSD